MDKTIIIGVGGTGLQVIRSLRKFVVETHGNLSALPHLGFLYVDTDPKEVVINEDNRRRWEVLGQSIALAQSEYKIIQAPEMGPIIRNISAFPQIEEWFPVEDLITIDQSARDTPGARQIRPLGRFTLALNMQEVETAFKSIYNRLPQAAGGGKTQIYLTCGLSGGTGSGMFLDLAYCLREWTAGNCELFGFLVLPELTTSRGERYLVNAYAALKELNYYNVGKSYYKVEKEGEPPKAFGFPLLNSNRQRAGGPFDYCYLVSPRNAADVELNLEALPEMIARRIYLNFDSSFADAAQSLLNNGSVERTIQLVDPFNKNIHSQNFFTFGLASIQYPVEQLVEIFSYKICHSFFEALLESREIPGDVNARVQGYLPVMKLTDEYLLGNRDIFGTTDFDNYEKEVETVVNSIKQEALQLKKNLAPFVNRKQTEFETSFRHVGILKFYQNKRDDLNGAIQEVMKAVRQQIGTVLLDADLGYHFAVRAVAELQKILEEKQKSYKDRYQGLPQREKNSKDALAVYCSEISKAEGKIIFRDKAISEGLNKVGEAMKAYIASRIDTRAYDFGLNILAAILEEVKRLGEQLRTWKDTVELIRNDFQEEITRRKTYLSTKIASTKDFNGHILFVEEKVDALYNSLEVGNARHFLEERFFRPLKNKALSLLDASESRESIKDRLYQLSLEWFRVNDVIQVIESNVADQLLEDYPDEAQRRNLIAENFRKSAYFLEFDEVQRHIGRGTDGAYVFAPTTFVRKVGILDDDEGRIPSVATVRRDVQSGTGVELSDIEPISDPHQMLFLQEITAFPLRLTRDLQQLKSKSDQYLKQQHPIPLHIRKSFNPPLMELFLVSDEERKQFEVAEESFLLGKVLGRLQIEENKRELRDEVRYRYMEGGTETYEALGENFEEAYDFFMSDTEEAEKIRNRLVVEMNGYLKKLDTRPKKNELWKQLAEHLEQIKSSAELGEEDAIFHKYDRITRRLVQRHKLFDEKSSITKKVSPPTGEASEKSLSDAEERYLKLARTALRNGQGKLTQAAMNMLKSNQRKYGLSDETAERLLTLAQSEFATPDANAEYREMFLAFYEDGEISDEERATLIETQVDLGLTDEEVQRIEQEVLEKGHPLMLSP